MARRDIRTPKSDTPQPDAERGIDDRVHAAGPQF